jgi:hypothetical protein
MNDIKLEVLTAATLNNNYYVTPSDPVEVRKCHLLSHWFFVQLIRP